MNDHDIPDGGRMTHMERRLLLLRDQKVRRCDWCGEWAYDRDDCPACACPADRAELYRRTS